MNRLAVIERAARRAALGMYLQPADADDVVQEVLVRADALGVSEIRSPVAWARVVTRNVVRSFLRKETLRRRVCSLEDLRFIEDPPAPKRHRSLAQQVHDLERVWSRLTPANKDVVTAHVRPRNVPLLQKDLAKELGITEPAIKGRVHRAKSQVRELF